MNLSYLFPHVEYLNTIKMREIMVRIRLSLNGSKKRPFYKVVVTDSRNSRDGRFTEIVGYFNPININNSFIKIKLDRINYWIKNGATLSKRVSKLLKEFNRKLNNNDKKS